jgi:uncharacterized protein
MGSILFFSLYLIHYFTYYSTRITGVLAMKYDNKKTRRPPGSSGCFGARGGTLLMRLANIFLWENAKAAKLGKLTLPLAVFDQGSSPPATKQQDDHQGRQVVLVRGVGLEPTCLFGHDILSVACIPIPPPALTSRLYTICYTGRMKQIVIIHGGNSFSSHEAYLQDLKEKELDYERLLYSGKWREWVAQTITDADVLLPDFPNKQNAQYDEWRIYFEKLLPLLTGKVSLVGYSLGAMFLAKYLHEKPLKNQAYQLILIAPCYDDESTEDLGSFKVKSAKGLEASAE